MFPPALNQFKNYVAALLALLCCALLFGFIQPVRLSPQERESLAAKFRFQRLQLPQTSVRKLQTVRKVHPCLQSIVSWISATGAAVALCDLDGDGKSNDLVTVDPRTDEVCVVPAPGTGDRFCAFTLKPDNLPYDATMAPMGVLVGDVNEDGNPDIVVYYWGRTPVAFLNKSRASKNGLTSEQFVAQELVSGNSVWNTATAVFADFDGDGHQDILFCNYFADGTRVLDPNASGLVELPDSIGRAFNGGGKHLLLWAGKSATGNVSYKEQDNLFSPEVAGGWTIAVGAADLDGDMLPEIYMANDAGPDRLLHNLSTPGHLKFSLLEGRDGFAVPNSFVLGKDSFKGMGVDFGDVNHDGVPDIYVSNIACPFGLEESHFLWLSTGGAEEFGRGIAPYKQASEDLGLSLSGWAWDCRLADFNNDGVAEALQATGLLKGTINRWPELQALGTANSTMLNNPRNWPCFKPGDDVSGHETNCFFVQSAGKKYFDLATDVGVADTLLSRGIAVGDLDADGRLDFVVANQWAPSFVYRNQAPGAGKFLAIRLLLPVDDSGATKVISGALPPSAPASPAIGATAKVHLPDGTMLSQFVDGGSGHTGRRAQELHFGLGDAPSNLPLRVDLKWRTRQGQLKQKTLQLAPGWYTIELSGKESAA